MAFQPIYAIKDRHGRGTLLPYNQGVNDGSTLTLDFTTGVLDPRLTFTRTSNATFINSSGYVEFAGQNVLTFTADLTQWGVKNNVNTTGWESKPDPFGGNTAVLLTPTGTVTPTNHNIQSASVTSATIGNGLRTIYSVYAKAATSRYTILGMVVSNSNAQATFTLTGSGSTVVAPIGTGVTSSITALGDGWYRCSMTWPSYNASAEAWLMICNNAVGTPSGQTFVAQSDDVSGGHGIFVYGAQWEQGAIAHPFIPTTGAAKSNVPRFDHDPTTGAPRGLLVEGTATNRALRSNDFNTTVTDGTQWIVSGYTRGDVSTTLPDGTTGNACRIFGTGSASFRTPSIAVNASTAYTFSFWARNNGGSQARYRVWNATAGSSIVDYTLPGSNYVSQIGGANNTSTTWVRVFVQFTTPVGCTSIFVYPTSSDTGTVDVLLWGAQVEEGSGAPSSYIPTGASQVTRNADECSMTGTNFSSWFNSSEGTFTVRFQTTYSGQSTLPSYILALDNSGSKRIVYMNTSAETAASYDGVTIVGGSGDATGVDARVASAYSTTERAFVLNGGTVLTGSVAAGYSTATSLAIGSNSTFATFRQIKFYPTRLTNAQLQAITT